jgi:hypothetical protein
MKQLKQDYGKKLADMQIQNNELREYIKKKSQEYQ